MFLFMVFLRPRPPLYSVAQCTDDDKVALHKLLEECNNVLINDSKFIPLGKVRPDNIRPLKIIYGSKEEATKLLESFSDAMRSGVTFPQGFRAFKDKTLLQRNLLRSCHLELDHRTNNGETGICIKYINGVPKVIFNKSKNGVLHLFVDLSIGLSTTMCFIVVERSILRSTNR